MCSKNLLNLEHPSSLMKAFRLGHSGVPIKGKRSGGLDPAAVMRAHWPCSAVHTLLAAPRLWVFGPASLDLAWLALERCVESLSGGPWSQGWPNSALRESRGAKSREIVWIARRFLNSPNRDALAKYYLPHNIVVSLWCRIQFFSEGAGAKAGSCPVLFLSWNHKL